jgi:hypothetical protein
MSPRAISTKSLVGHRTNVALWTAHARDISLLHLAVAQHSMKGTFCICASRIFAPIFSLRRFTSTRKPRSAIQTYLLSVFVDAISNR